jgi:hypothetical protein
MNQLPNLLIEGHARSQTVLTMGKEDVDLDSKFQNENSDATPNSTNITIPNDSGDANKPELNSGHERRRGTKKGGCDRGGDRGRSGRRGTDGGGRHKRGEMGRAEWRFVLLPCLLIQD